MGINLCKKCANGLGTIQSIKGDCKSVGGIQNRVWFADISNQLPTNVVKNEDGSVASFSLGKCGQLYELSMRPDLANILTTKTESENGLVYVQTVNLFANDLGDQKTKNAIRRLENAQRVIVIYEDKNGVFEIAGFGEGLRGNGGERGTGATISEANRNAIVLTSNENDVPVTLDAGSREATLEFLEVLSRPAINFDFKQINTAQGVTNSRMTSIKGFGSVLQATLTNGFETFFVESLDKGNSWRVSSEVGVVNSILSTIVKENAFVYNKAGSVYVVKGLTFDTLASEVRLFNYTASFFVSIQSLSSNQGILFASVISSLNNTNVRLAISTDLDPVNVQLVSLQTGLASVGFTSCGIDNDGFYWVLAVGNNESELYRSLNGTDYELVNTHNFDSTSMVVTSNKLSFVDGLIFFNTRVGLFRFDSGNWSQVLSVTNNFANEVYKSNFGYFTTRGRIVYRSNDCGLTWQIFNDFGTSLRSFELFADSLFAGAQFVGSPDGVRIFKNYLKCLNSDC